MGKWYSTCKAIRSKPGSLFLVLPLLLLHMACLYGQVPVLHIDRGVITQITIGSSTLDFSRPVVSYEVGDKWYNSGEASPLSVSIDGNSATVPGRITFTNNSKDTLRLHNIVPFAPTGKEVFITGKGTHRLSRTHLFRPGLMPVNVIVPDNAWDLGYCDMLIAGQGITGLTRRDPNSYKLATRRRFETVIAPGGSVGYLFYVESYKGTWQDGLRKMFQERKLHDVEAFDESIYNRLDLKWIQSAYVMHLMMAWDNDYYSRETGKFNWQEFLKRGKRLYGGDDVICLWPTWPTLGLDQRNQFDMYRDLPGGLKALRILADTLRKNNIRFFIAYNPWDESTRSQGHLQGLEQLIRDTSADGVVLDTKGESSKELQQAADQVKPGVIMYSEGMAVPKDMSTIVSGRVHNALYYPPLLNLNKLIKPDFAIFRVAEVYKEPIQREFAVAFFNGYGTEINQFAPGHPEWEDEQYKFLGKTSRILRENHSNFVSKEFSVLYPTTHDSLWVNRWPLGDKTIYTIFSLKPEGFAGKIIKVTKRAGYHWVDLFHHSEATVQEYGGDYFVEVGVDSFNKSFLGTNNEGQSGCLAELPEAVSSALEGNLLRITSQGGTVLKVWKGDPDYEKDPILLASGNQVVDTWKSFGRYEGKIVIQLFNKDELLDETIVVIKPGTPRLVSKSVNTKGSVTIPRGMAKVPSGNFTFKVSHGDDFIPYPTNGVGQTSAMKSFYMDKFPVTNGDFKVFLDASGYKPSDTSNFLRHWQNKQIPKGEEHFPIVYVSYEDAQAYAKWAGKRLPTELEWQYAAQTDKGKEWPWKQESPVARKEQFVTETLTVSALEGIDPKNCNLGDGKPYAVGSYVKGSNPFGLQDLVGCVWQLTNDLYESGSYGYIMMKGGSYFKPSSSWWYVQGGPRELHYRQFLLRVSQGFERNATVGFRCIKDTD